MLCGVLLLYGPVWASQYFDLSHLALVFGQSLYAIGCIIAAYSITGPVRGATMSILSVVLVFSAFVLPPWQLHRISVSTIALLGLTMLWMQRHAPQVYKSKEELVHFILAASMLAAISFLSGRLSLLRQRLKVQKTELAEALTCIQTLATLDDLTLLTNRRYMNEVLAREKQRHNRIGHTLCMALLDLDWFKRVNDTYGHAAGDEVLRCFAQQAHATVRSVDVLARWGGEEFLLLMPDTEIPDAIVVLERVKVQIAALRWNSIDPELHITFSAGLAASHPGESAADMIKRADQAMYRAKDHGRNQVVIAP